MRDKIGSFVLIGGSVLSVPIIFVVLPKYYGRTTGPDENANG